MKVGSAEHRDVLCRFFRDTHIDFEPEEIQWPELDDDELERIVNLPFWGEAVETETATSHTVQAAAGVEPDPEISEAIAVQGFEEGRHARLLDSLTRFYSIPVPQPEPPSDGDVEGDFLFAGYGECFDSFFAFGLFELARRSGYFTPGLIEIFEPVMQEEARHILFFVNWVAYRRARMSHWERNRHRLRCLAIILRQVMSRINTARSLQDKEQTENFTMKGHQDFADSMSLKDFLQICLQENNRRLSQYHPDLLRPRLVPGAARFLTRMLPGSRHSLEAGYSKGS